MHDGVTYRNGAGPLSWLFESVHSPLLVQFWLFEQQLLESAHFLPVLEAFQSSVEIGRSEAEVPSRHQQSWLTARFNKKESTSKDCLSAVSA